MNYFIKINMKRPNSGGKVVAYRKAHTQMQLPPPEADFEQMSEEEIALSSSIVGLMQGNDHEEAKAYQDAYIIDGVPIEDEVNAAR